MWHPPWGGYVPSGYLPQTINCGDLPGQPMLAFNGGGFLPQGPPTAPNLPQSSPPGQWSQPGPAMWQPPSSTTPLGTFSGSQTTTGPPTFQRHFHQLLLWELHIYRFQDLLCHLHLLEMPFQDLTWSCRSDGTLAQHTSGPTSSDSRTPISASFRPTYFLNRNRLQSFGRPFGCSFH